MKVVRKIGDRIGVAFGVAILVIVVIAIVGTAVESIRNDVWGVLTRTALFLLLVGVALWQLTKDFRRDR